jgi:hypothetical protein
MMENGRMDYRMVVEGLSMMMVQFMRVVLKRDLLSVEMHFLLKKMELFIKVKLR